MAKWKFDYQAHMQDKYEQVFADLQSRYLQEVEGINWRAKGRAEGREGREGRKREREGREERGRERGGE